MNPTTIKVIISEHFGLTVKDLEGPSRTANIAWARALAMERLSVFVRPKRAGALLNRDRTTALKAIKRVEEWTSNLRSKERRDYEAVKAKLQLTLL